MVVHGVLHSNVPECKLHFSVWENQASQFEVQKVGNFNQTADINGVVAEEAVVVLDGEAMMRETGVSTTQKDIKVSRDHHCGLMGV